jgi:hypothetical protein
MNNLAVAIAWRKQCGAVKLAILAAMLAQFNCGPQRERLTFQAKVANLGRQQIRSQLTGVQTIS